MHEIIHTIGTQSHAIENMTNTLRRNYENSSQNIIVLSCYSNVFKSCARQLQMIVIIIRFNSKYDDLIMTFR